MSNRKTAHAQAKLSKKLQELNEEEIERRIFNTAQAILDEIDRPKLREVSYFPKDENDKDSSEFFVLKFQDTFSVNALKLAKFDLFLHSNWNQISGNTERSIDIYFYPRADFIAKLW